MNSGSRALRVDVLGRRLASADLVLDFHERHPDVEIDVLGLGGARPAFDALLDGSVDVAFCCIRDASALPGVISHARVYDEPLDLLVGPGHSLARSRGVRLSDLTGHRVWVPGIVAGSEWGGYYEAMAEAFRIRIDPAGPNFGLEHLLDTIAGSAALATFVGARTRIVWSTGTGSGAFRSAVRRPSIRGRSHGTRSTGTPPSRSCATTSTGWRSRSPGRAPGLRAGRQPAGRGRARRRLSRKRPPGPAGAGR